MTMRLQISLMVLFALFTGTAVRASEISSVKTIVKGTCIEIQFISPKIIRVLKYANGMQLQKESLVVIKTARKTEVKINEQSGFKELSTAALKILIDKQTGQVSFQNLKKESLLKEGAMFSLANTVKGFKGVKQSFALSGSEAIYGLGQHQKGTMNQRNQKLYLKQSNMEIAIPFFNLQTVMVYIGTIIRQQFLRIMSVVHPLNLNMVNVLTTILLKERMPTR